MSNGRVGGAGKLRGRGRRAAASIPPAPAKARDFHLWLQPERLHHQDALWRIDEVPRYFDVL
jgi:hypothetical protein